MRKTGKLVVVTGPSGAGKGTVVSEVRRRTGAAFSVSATTRRPRPGEIDGREYRFVDRATFGKMIELEWAEIYGDYYGTPAAPVRQAVSESKTIFLEIDCQGGLQVRERMPEAVFILILPPDLGELTNRLTSRKTESPEALRRRLGEAEKEIQAARCSGIYAHTVINNDLERTVNEVIEITTQEPDGR